MTENEIRLLSIIRENDNQEEAIVMAVNIILSFLERSGSFEVQAPAYPPGPS